MTVLTVQKRDIKKSPAALRQEGFIPAVFYGRKAKSTPIAVSRKDFLKVWKQAGESAIITLKTGDEDQQVLIQDVDRHPVTGMPIHADFYAIEKDKKLRVKIPIEFTGVAPAVKDLGGILVKVLHELEIESLPKDLPHGVTVDISALADFKSQILAKAISLPEGVALTTNLDEVVAAVAEPKEEEEQPAEAVDLSAIEVEKKGKEAKEGQEEGEVAASEGGKSPR